MPQTGAGGSLFPAVWTVLVCSLLCMGISGRRQTRVEHTYHSFENQRLDTAPYKTLNTPNVAICNQMCTSDTHYCYSYNYNPKNQICALNSVSKVHDDTQNLVNDMQSIYAEKKLTEGPCEKVCHPDGTLKCVPGYWNGERYVKQICICHAWSEGEHCEKQEARQCTTDGNCYEASGTPATYTDAVTACTNLKGYLATADSADEQKALESFMERQHTEKIFLGVKFYPNYAGWALSSNLQPLTGYTNWHTDTEHNPTEANYCTSMSSGDNYRWRHQDCSESLHFICQIPSCPEGYQAFNGSCYYFDNTVRYWGRNSDQCINRGLVALTPSYLEEDNFIANILQSTYGTSYPFSLGIHDWNKQYEFRMIHNDWIVLDWNNRKTHLGCWTDTPDRSITVLEGTDPLLTGSYTDRSNPTLKCYYVNKKRHFKVFAVQNSGHCQGDTTAHLTYDKYGEATNCAGGEGGSWANDVYKIDSPYLFMDMAWDSGWNGGERVYFWWHGDSWRWHDAGITSSSRSVCVEESCPSGFFAYANKCYKFVAGNHTWENARDTCQTYRNADLIHPEYPDEFTVIQNELNARGALGPIWTGIVNIGSDSHPQHYKVMNKKLSENYNTYKLGAEPIWRYNQDGASSGTQVEMRWTFPVDAKIIAWEYYSGASGKPLIFSVMRPMGNQVEGNCNFLVMGQNRLTSESNFVRVNIPVNEQLVAQKGDHIAVSYTAGSCIRFNSEASDNICSTHTSQPVLNQPINLELGNHGRIYSYRAIWKPLNDEAVPYDSVTSSLPVDGDCYATVETADGMRLRSADCATELPALCEIKKKNRFSPDPRI